MYIFIKLHTDFKKSQKLQTQTIKQRIITKQTHSLKMSQKLTLKLFMAYYKQFKEAYEKNALR